MAVVAVTGANGFVGRHLVDHLCESHTVRCGVRTLATDAPGWGDSVGRVSIGSVGPETDWSSLLRGADVVVHLASIAHLRSTDPTEIQAVNVDGTRHLAESAAANGVRRMVFVSSIGVHGGESADVAIDEMSAIAPHDAYSASKAAAEEAMLSVASSGALETVIVRPPLIYGPGAPGNFGRLLRLVESGLPLPFGRVDNRRSLVSIGNLCDFLRTVIDTSEAAGERFVIADEDVASLPHLLNLIAAAMGRRSRVFPVPVRVLRLMFSALGRAGEFRKLTSDLVVDTAKARARLGWSPPESLEDGLRFAVGGLAASGE